MFNMLKVIGVAVAGGAIVGAFGSSKVGSFFRRDEEKFKLKKTQVKVVEVAVDSDNPSELEVIVLKKTDSNKKNK